MGLWRKKTAAPSTGSPVVSDPVTILRQSKLVDEDWYRATYPDVVAAGADPVEDYLARGARGDRNPNLFFDSAWYLETYPDVAAKGINPLMHFIVSGAAEGRSAGPHFDTAYYLAENPAVAAEAINPLAHFLRYGRNEGRSAKPRDEAEAFESAIRAQRQGLGGATAAFFHGARADHVHFTLPPKAAVLSGRDLPLPSLELAQRIGSVTLQDFDDSGRSIRDAIVRALPADFRWEGARVLDFGSGVGRALRHFADRADRAEIWGCDIDGASIRWSVRNLSPPFRFFQIGEMPTAPFEDNSFDLVYAISVFSHIHTGWHQWLMEIRRILKPGGTFFISFLGPSPCAEMLGEPYWERGADFGMYVKNPHNNWNMGGPMIFVSPDWITSFWGSLFNIDYIAIDGLMDDQSFCLMRKPERGEPIKTDVPVLQLGTRQAFNKDALGRIMPRLRTDRPFRESYGLDCSSAESGNASGWIVFRGDEARTVDISIDGAVVRSDTAFETSGAYRDWPETMLMSFSAAFDLSGIAPGRHELEARFKSRRGLSHSLSIPLLVR
jgi:SAM-dependent methyltransferase